MEQLKSKLIRNFCIVAHVDHGKSTLADRLLEMTGTVEKRDMQEQILDSNPIERERGITIKLAPVRMRYKVAEVPQVPEVSREVVQKSNIKNQISNNLKLEIGNLKLDNSSSAYVLNLIDTPGHVDFNYEVSRSLAACEGAILVVDATQGVQAQTLANLTLARKQNLTIIPVINKIDLPNAQIEKTKQQIYDLGFKHEEIIKISAKIGTNIDQVLEAVVTRIPSPVGSQDSPLRALVFSSEYDVHKGVVVYVRIVDGEISVKGEALSVKSKLKFIASGAEFAPLEIGYFTPAMTKSGGLFTGEVGFIATGLKDSSLAKVGDTITIGKVAKVPRVPKVTKEEVLKTFATFDTFGTSDTFVKALPGYQEPKPMVFLGLYPLQSENINQVRDALSKLRLSDSAFTFKPISSLALGNGFHCGFLGLLHAEVVQERLSREFGLNLLATAPTVEYRIKIKEQRSKIKKNNNVILGNPDLIGMTPESELNQRILDKPVRKSIKADSGQARMTLDEDDTLTTIQSAAEFPDPSTIEQAYEPVMEVTIFSPQKYTGNVMQLCQNKRAEYIDMKYFGTHSVIPDNSHVIPGLTGNLSKEDPRSSIGVEDKFYEDDNIANTTIVKFTYLMPLSEMIIDFFDALKSATEGYASLDYQFFDYQKVNLVKLDILLNHEKVDAFSQVVVSEKAQYLGGVLVDKLKDVIPKHQFNIPIQATIGGKIVARADVKPYRKDVTQKLYGGDRTRKDKLLEAQKKGKKKMKQIGNVEIPQNAFLEVFKQE